MGARVTTSWIVEQFGLATTPLCASSASAFTSGTTSGTSGLSRKSLPLSITIAPREMASRASCTAAPFSPSVPAKRARSTPSKASGSATPTSKVSPARVALRALRARTRSSFKGKSRLLSSATSRSPTSPAPTTATVNPSGISNFLRAVVSYRLTYYIKQVPYDPARGAVRPRARTRHRERDVRVAAGLELEDVLGAIYGTERALDRRLRQPNLYGSVFRDTCQVPEHVVLPHRVHPLSELGVRLRESLQEF